MQRGSHLVDPRPTETPAVGAPLACVFNYQIPPHWASHVGCFKSSDNRVKHRASSQPGGGLLRLSWNWNSKPLPLRGHSGVSLTRNALG